MKTIAATDSMTFQKLADGIAISYALKLSPHEQLVAAFGFFTLKPPSVRASE